MKRFMFSAMFAVAAIALVLSATAANAAEERPFKAIVESTRQSSDVKGHTAHLIYSGTAIATHLGCAEAVTVVDIDLKTGIATGVAVLSSSDVDSITIEFVQVFDPAQAAYVGEYQITGGSGKFEGAGGGGTLVNAAGDEPGTRVGEYDGTIIY